MRQPNGANGTRRSGSGKTSRSGGPRGLGIRVGERPKDQGYPGPSSPDDSRVDDAQVGNGKRSGPGSFGPRPGLDWKKTEAQEHARSRGGTVEWCGRATGKSKWTCHKGHTWEAPWTRIKKTGHWCARCAHDAKVLYETSERQWAIRRCHVYRQHDRKAGREFRLVVGDVEGIRSLGCHYCHNRKASGLDRRDSSIGHVPENCVPCCLRCNRVKCDLLSYDVMLQVGALLARIDP